MTFSKSHNVSLHLPYLPTGVTSIDLVWHGSRAPRNSGGTNIERHTG